MDLQLQRDLRLLSEVEQNPSISQRFLAKQLGVALGLTNLYLKRLVNKGYIKITTIPKSRIKYLLTPRGMAEKSRLTYEYMQYSLTYYQEIRHRFKEKMSELSNEGAKRVVVYGTGELAELVYLSVREMEFTLVGFVIDDDPTTFLSYPVWPLQELIKWNFDAVLIAEIDGARKVKDRILELQVVESKIISLLPS